MRTNQDSREPFLQDNGIIFLCSCNLLSVEQAENGEMCEECEHHDDLEMEAVIDNRIRIYFS